MTRRHILFEKSNKPNPLTAREAGGVDPSIREIVEGISALRAPDSALFQLVNLATLTARAVGTAALPTEPQKVIASDGFALEKTFNYVRLHLDISQGENNPGDGLP